MENYHIITVRPLTNEVEEYGYRVQIVSKRFNCSRKLSFTPDTPYTIDVAVKYLKDKGFDIIGKAEDGEKGYFLITTTFEKF